MKVIHRVCGKEMRELPGGYFFRCDGCDSIPIVKSDLTQIELRKQEAGKKD
ncbi:MAG: hypothetical protein P4L74_05200 [Candidatus Doudnabacteria bacterium]|nr:hypothetical protein [Candidatus Doudnabacteria bacterium]